MSGLLLDSNALIWWLDGDLRIAPVSELISSEPQLFVSLASPWELWIKQAAGKIRLPDRFIERIEGQAIEIIPPSLSDARRATGLPLLHRDPFDRMIVAQALNRQASLITADRQLAAYGVKILAL